MLKWMKKAGFIFIISLLIYMPTLPRALATLSTVSSNEITETLKIDWAALTQKWQLRSGELENAVAGLLESIARNDPHFTRNFIKTFAEESLLEKTKSASLISQINKISTTLPTFELLDIIVKGDTHFHLIVGSDHAIDGSNDAKEKLIKVIFSPETPSKFLSFEFSDIVSPYPKIPDFSSYREAKDFLKDIAEKNIFSGAISVFSEGENKLLHAYGLANRTSGRANTITTRFDIGSITKFYTSIALYKLAEEGRLNLDNKLSAYIDSLPNEILHGPTIQQIIEMAGGFGHYYDDEIYSQNPSSYRRVNDIMPVIARTPLLFTPGTEQRYSNSGFIVLGAVIEAITGMRYSDYIQKVIFEPAGMKDSGFYAYAEADLHGAAIPYSLMMSGGDTPQDVRSDFNYRGMPDGGAFATVSDLTAFSQALTTGRIISQSSLSRLIAPFQSKSDVDLSKKRREAVSGFIGLAGGAQGVSAVWYLDFESNTTVVVLANTDEPIAEDIGQKLFYMTQRKN